MLDDIKKTLWAHGRQSTSQRGRCRIQAPCARSHLPEVHLRHLHRPPHRDRGAAKDPADNYFFADATPKDIATELEVRYYYQAANVFWMPEGARWDTVRALAKRPKIGKVIDDTLSIIEAENPKLKGILDKRYARAQLPDGKLAELVDLISTIGFGENASTARDVLGPVYEYFLGMFASAEGKRGG